MNITMKTAEIMMDIITYTLQNTICHDETFEKISDKERAKWLDNTTKKLFMYYCDDRNINKIEE